MYLSMYLVSHCLLHLSESNNSSTMTAIDGTMCVPITSTNSTNDQRCRPPVYNANNSVCTTTGGEKGGSNGRNSSNIAQKRHISTSYANKDSYVNNANMSKFI